MSFVFHLKNGMLLLFLGVSGFIVLSLYKGSHKRVNPPPLTEALMAPTVTLETTNYDILRKRLDMTINSIPGYREHVQCDELASPSQGFGAKLRKAQKWVFDDIQYWNIFGANPAICHAIKETFAFVTEPMSQEEFEYPLAYSLLVHSNAVQVLFLLSSIYQPQNQFCVAVDEGADDEFKRQMFLLGECFPNIFVMIMPKVHWCGFSVLQGVYACVEYLVRLRDDWKYYQYLSGVDLPLKTNLEMVRIFKKLNGSFNAGIHDLPNSRYGHGSPPLPLWKSSLSATFSRESANFMVHNPKVQELYEYLKQALCPDETFWTTIAGNPGMIEMPGGFNAQLWKDKLTGEWDKEHGTNESKPLVKEQRYSLFVPEKYYISRYQVWHTRNYRKLGYKCFGRFAAESCVFGAGDVAELVKRPELVAHKFYLSTQPAGYFCMYEIVRRRALKANEVIDVDAYGELPGPKLLAGTPFDQVEFKAPGGYDFY
uniref:Glycosyltransferase n=1 Tax=Steinernema glaseri TaxID=37863 RepID=A0A1I8AG73_9BILA